MAIMALFRGMQAARPGAVRAKCQFSTKSQFSWLRGAGHRQGTGDGLGRRASIEYRGDAGGCFSGSFREQGADTPRKTHCAGARHQLGNCVPNPRNPVMASSQTAF